MIHIDGSSSKLYMKFDKILPSAQGMGIWDDRVYILYDTGKCAVYGSGDQKRSPDCGVPTGFL